MLKRTFTAAVAILGLTYMSHYSTIKKVESEHVDFAAQISAVKNLPISAFSPKESALLLQLRHKIKDVQTYEGLTSFQGLIAHEYPSITSDGSQSYIELKNSVHQIILVVERIHRINGSLKLIYNNYELSENIKQLQNDFEWLNYRLPQVTELLLALRTQYQGLEFPVMLLESEHLLVNINTLKSHFGEYNNLDSDYWDFEQSLTTQYKNLESFVKVQKRMLKNFAPASFNLHQKVIHEYNKGRFGSNSDGVEDFVAKNT